MVAIAMLFRAENDAKIRLDVLLARLASVIIVAGTPIMRYHSPSFADGEQETARRESTGS
jgi:hypothetical protein